jgi:phenylacetic acid degradation operon negative regulatory protein
MNCNDWIARFLAEDPPRSKSLVVTIFGDAIVPHGGTVWLGSLIELLAPFGVNDRLLRTSVFRLAQEGWLGSQRDGRRSSYAITPGAMARFRHAYRRIYAPLAVHWDGHWTLVINSGEIDAAERAAMRKESSAIRRPTPRPCRNCCCAGACRTSCWCCTRARWRR